MYVILVNKDNSMNATKKARIVQKSKLVDDFYFLVEPEYNGHDMSKATVLLEYLTPVSRKYRTETLVLDKDGYKGHLKYILPVDTNFTAEAGSLEIQLSFIYIDDINGVPIQRVRKTTPPLKVEISPIAAWSDIVPDDALTVIDQRIVAQTAQIQALAEIAVALNDDMVDNLVYNEKEDTLQLTANGKGVGDKVSVKDMLDEGIPVVDLDSGAGGDSSDDSDHEDGCDCGCDCEDNVVVFSEMPTTDNSGNTEDDEVVEF